MIPGFHELLSRLTYAVGFNNPEALGVLFVMGVLTDIGFPLLFTVEIFLLFASYYVGPLSIQVLLIVLMLLLGRATGGSLLYWMSYYLGEPFLNWISRYFPWLCRGVNQLKSRINQHTTLVVALVRLTPGFLQVPSLVTGSLRLKYLSFLLGLIFSSLIYDFTIVLFGYLGQLTLGNSRQQVEDFFIIGFIVIIIITWTILFFKYRRSFNNKDNEK